MDNVEYSKTKMIVFAYHNILLKYDKQLIQRDASIKKCIVNIVNDYQVFTTQLLCPLITAYAGMLITVLFFMHAQRKAYTKNNTVPFQLVCEILITYFTLNQLRPK